MSKPGHVRQFLWERDNLLAELDSAGTLIAEYSYYPGMDNPHAMLVGNTKYFAHSDIAGNVTALTDSARNLARWYESTAWGTFSNGGDIAGLAGKDRSRFKGALWFGDALGDLYYMRDRWYEPRSGRFLSEDPIGSNPGVNPYAFAGNDPVDLRDPSGDDLTPVTLPDGSTVWMDCYTFGDATKCYAVDVGGDTVWGEGGGSGDDGSGHKDDGPGVERGPGAGVGVRPRQRAKNACYENNKFSSLFGGGKASQIVSWAETGSAISLGSDIVAMTLKATRTGAGGSVNPYASGFNMAGRAIVRTGGRALKLSNSAIGRGVGYVNAVGDKVSPVLAIIGAFTLAYNTTIDIQCRLGILQ